MTRRTRATAARPLLPAGAAVLVVVVALSPPVASAGEGSVTAHMVQHLLLVAVVAPLLALSVRRQPDLLLALPPAARRRSLRGARALRSPLGVGAATAAAVAALWVWHVPVLYDAAVDDRVLHGVEHLTLLGAALVFFVVVLDPRTPAHLALAALTAGAFGHALLGGLLTFASRPLYASAAADGLADQQLAGLLMWVPGGAPHLLAASLVVSGAIRLAAERTDRRERIRRERSRREQRRGRPERAGLVR